MRALGRKAKLKLFFLSCVDLKSIMGLPLWLSSQESTCRCRRYRFIPWWGRSPGGGNGAPLQYSCWWNAMDRGDWLATVYGVTKILINWVTKEQGQWGMSLGFPCGSLVKNLSAMQEMQVWSLGWEDLLEGGLATHSSILAWKIPWTEEPDRLKSMGSQTVIHVWNNWTHIHTHKAKDTSTLIYFHTLFGSNLFLYFYFVSDKSIHCMLILCFFWEPTKSFPLFLTQSLVTNWHYF